MTGFAIIGGLFIISSIILGEPVVYRYLSTGMIGSFFIMRAIISGIFFILGAQICSLGLIGSLLREERLLIKKLGVE